MDTSVLYQALYSRNGASHAILRLIREGTIQLALSVPVYGEYQDVLSRPAARKDFNLSGDDVQTMLQFIAYIGVPFPIHFQMRPNLRDEADNLFVELAFASGSEYLITRNIRDFTVDTDLNLSQLAIVTPTQFMQKWRGTYGNQT